MELLIGLGVIICIVAISKTKRYSYNREFKKCESPIEEQMFNALKKKGYKPYTQIPCRGYRIDVALYHKRRKIAIECDGKAFHTSPKQVQHDKTKDMVLKKEKWIVLRFTGSEIYKSSEKCVEEIERYLH